MSRLVNLSVQSVRNVQRFNKHTLENIKSFSDRFETRIKGTIVENWMKFWKTVFNDYRDVAIDVKTNIKQKPFSCAVIFSTLGFLAACAKNNPNLIDFKDQYITWSNQMILVHPTVQNPVSLEHLRLIEMCFNKHQIRRLNLIIGSIVWRDDSSSVCKSYIVNCPYLQIQYSQFTDRILDVGFFNKWWVLERKMIDYDVNY